jgi:hypothetical protein
MLFVRPHHAHRRGKAQSGAMSITHQVFIEPSAIAIGLPDQQVVLCIEVFERAGIKVHRAEATAAIELVGKVLPHIVVVARALESRLRDMVDDRAVAVGAVLVELEANQDFGTIEKKLEAAVNKARALRGKKPLFS